MDKWIPLVQTLVWPAFILVLAVWFRRPIRVITTAVLDRVAAGRSVRIGPIELQEVSLHSGGGRAAAEATIAGASRRSVTAAGEPEVPLDAESVSDAALCGSAALRRVWEPFADIAPLIAVTGFPQMARDFEPFGVTGFGEALALSRVHATLVALDVPDVNVLMATSPHIASAIPGSPLIALGGPDGNPVAARILARSRGGLAFAGLDIVDRLSGVSYSAFANAPREEFVDYGLVLLGRSPHDLRQPAMVLAGCYGFGTLAAALVITDTKMVGQLTETAAGGEFEAVVQVHVTAGRMGPPEVVFARSVPAAVSAGSRPVARS